MGYYRAKPDKNIVIDKIMKWIVDIVVVIVLAIFFITYFCGQYKVVGNSMNKTLDNKDTVLINSLSYNLSNPERNDVIVFEKKEKNGDKVKYIKRIVGLPGETIQIKDGYIMINGKKMGNSHIEDKIVNAGLASEQIKLAYNEYFVIGDNVNNSEDSRSNTVSTVKKNEIQGKAWLTAWPFVKIKLIK